MFGRLVAQLGIADAQALLARSESAVLDWLRRNGRYLTPAGARDVGIAIATYLRAIIAIHTEALLGGLALLLLVTAPHLVQQAAGGFDPASWQDWHTLWWPLALAVWLLAAPGAMAAYWVARDSADPSQRHVAPGISDLLFLVVFAIAVCAANVYAWPFPGALERGEVGALAIVGALLAAWSCVAGMTYTQLRLFVSAEPHALAVARLRNRLTRALRVIMLVSAAMAAVGAFDVASWWLLEVTQSGANWVWGGVGVGGISVIVLRALAQPLQQLTEKAKTGVDGDWGPRLLNAAGVLGLLALVLAWLVLAQFVIFAPEPAAALRDVAPDMRALGIFAVALVWWTLSARNEQMANASSLHGFYRARLARAYLAVGNTARGLLGGGCALATSVQDVIPGDDLELAHYRPEDKGGPVHLINACLNQTRDDASGLYNADRKGTLLTASSRAIEVGPNSAVALGAAGPGAPEVGTLGRWVAVSGAAASPGAGAYTSAGWALMMFFLGIRLGYWMRAPNVPQGGWPASVRRLWSRAVKPLMLWSEASASFFGTTRPWWYLSDGGHFDNTGVYALLKRRLDFIILADNGADPDYRFGDVENLVRKARIDFGAEIEFYTSDEAAHHFPLAGGGITVLSPEIMADNHAARGVLLARVRYAPAADGSRAEATLLVVKPDLHDALDLDVLGYAQRHPSFPHESTADQSFDEEQWESYHRLGEDFGRALKLDWLDALPGWSRVSAHPMTVAARLRSMPPEPAATAVEPLWRRSARATAIGATLGLGASGTLLVAAWQIGDQIRQQIAAEENETRSLFTEVSRDLRDLDGSCPKVADHTTVQLMTLRDLRDSPRLRPLEREGVGQLIEHVRKECALPPAKSLECADNAQRAAEGICAIVNKPPTQAMALSYWHGTGAQAQISVARLLSGLTSGVLSASAPPATIPPTGTSVSIAPPPTPASPSALTTRGEGVPEAAPPPPPAAPEGACAVGGRLLQLYVQIYDEASRDSAGAVVRALQRDEGGALRIAPIENVTRSAALSGAHRPAPWPQPTLIVHNPADRACAVELGNAVRGALPATPGRDTSVWVRDLPRSLKPEANVIELWLPPSG